MTPPPVYQRVIDTLNDAFGVSPACSPYDMDDPALGQFEGSMHEAAHAVCLNLKPTRQGWEHHRINHWCRRKLSANAGDWQELKTLAVEVAAASLFNVDLDPYTLATYAFSEMHTEKYKTNRDLVLKEVERLLQAKTTWQRARRLLRLILKHEELLRDRRI